MPRRVNDGSKLTETGWVHDGLWWKSPHTGHRYAKREALAVEELRKWAASDSAILGDKNHSMWVLQEEEDCKLTTMEDLSKSYQQRKLLGERATRSNLKGEGTD